MSSSVQAAIAANGNGVLAVRVGPIEVGSSGDGEELLVHPLGIALQWQIGKEELVLRREVALKSRMVSAFPVKLAVRILS